MAAGLRTFPWERVESVPDGVAHQLVPGRMELDLVDSVAVTVVCAELGWVAVGVSSRPIHLRGCEGDARTRPAPS